MLNADVITRNITEVYILKNYNIVILMCYNIDILLLLLSFH